jgi:hypothetical protein
MKSRPHEGATGMPTDGHPFAMFTLSGNYSEVIVELTAAVEKALAIADALELSLVGIDLCSALERIKAMHPTANSEEMQDRD